MRGDFLFDCCQNPKNEKGRPLNGCITAATRLRPARMDCRTSLGSPISSLHLRQAWRRCAANGLENNPFICTGHRGSDSGKVSLRLRCNFDRRRLHRLWPSRRRGPAGFELEQRAGRDDGLSLMSWSLRFHMPIALPDGRKLRTLQHAGEYIQELPRAKHERPEWRTAIETLIAAVEERGPLMFAEMAVRKAVHAERRAPGPQPRRKAAKKHRVVK